MTANAHIEEREHALRIEFDEPVVLQSQVHQEPTQFTLTGDADHQPTSRWIDQDTLWVEFANGTSVFTPFCLSFKPGQDQYLSKAAMKQREFRFYCPRSELTIHPISGTPTTTFCVFPRNRKSKEAQQYSTATPVQYIFRSYTKEKNNKKSYEAPIPAVVEPARLGLIPEHRQHEALAILKDMKVDWKHVNKDTLVPGIVIARAPQPLAPEQDWEFRLIASEESGVKTSSNAYTISEPVTELGTGVSQNIATVDDQQKMRLNINFSAPINKSELEAIFQSISIQANGQTATTTGNAKTLSIQGKEITFTLLPPEKQRDARRGISLNDKNDESVSYSPDDTVQSIQMEFSDMPPTDLDIVVPAGTKAALGLATHCDHRHRLSITPAAPQLGNCTTKLPLHGAHSFQVPTLNVDALEIKTYHINAEQFQKIGKHITQLSEHAELASSTETLKYQLAVLEKQQDEKNQKTIQSLQRRIKQMESERILLNMTIAPFLHGTTAFPEQRLNLEAQNSTLLRSRTSTINLDTLTNGQTKPGVYVIAIKQKVSPAILTMLDAMGLKSDLFETERYHAILVTDLRVSADEEMLLLTRLSDGTLVKEGSVIDEKGNEQALQNGFCKTKGLRGNQYIVRAGEDYAITHRTNTYLDDDMSLRMEMFADRPLYRPGDTVNLRGILRLVSPTGNSSIPKAVKLLQLKVRRPNGETLQSLDITPNEYGAWSHSFTLPEGEEDITGRYRVEISTPNRNIENDTLSIPCQVFRRDAFTAEMKLEAESILPQEFTATVQAIDLNGTPLSNADVELQVNCSADILYRAKNDKETSSLTYRLKTDKEGKAVIKASLKTIYPESTGGSASLHITGSVANDRQEYKTLKPAGKRLYATDFYTHLSRSSICLYAVVDKQTILPREQTLHVRVMGRVKESEHLPGGIVITRYQDKCLLEKDITVPANCEEGIPLPLKEFINDSLADRRLIIHLTGTDSAGRSYTSRHHWYSWFDRSRTTTTQRNPKLEIKPGDNALQLNTETPRAGEALVVLHSRVGSRVISLQVNGDKETHTIPLQKNENGFIRCHLLQTTAGTSKLYTDWVDDEATCSIPRPETLLKVQLNTPTQDILPGSETELRGQVTLPDGTAADAEVTLFAVDMGMLSVAPYKLPDINANFARVNLPYLHFRSIDKEWLNNIEKLHPVLLAPLHPGKIIGPGKGIMNSTINYGARRAYKTRASIDDFAEEECAPVAAMGVKRSANSSPDSAPAPMPVLAEGGDEDSAEYEGEDDEGGPEPETPRLRTNFNPVAVWQAALHTNADGSFSTKVTLPDTLTTYRVFAVAASRCGKRFGQSETEFRVNQPVMLTPGTPLFMSLGDCLRLPLTITNNTNKADTWTVTLDGATAPQSIALQPGTTGTLFFDFTAAKEGDNVLRWTAKAAAGGDAVEGSFPVRFPAPVLKETHRLVLASGANSVKLATLAAPELASSTRSAAQVELSANPLLHLASAMDFVLSYPYGCTEQTASGLLPWIFHSRLAPFSPTMQSVSQQEVNKVITEAIEKLFKRQRPDGGLSYWSSLRESSLWASAHAAMVFTIAEENGVNLPAEKMKNLRQYLSTRSEEELKELSPYTRYAIGRACQNEPLIIAALADVKDEKPVHPRWFWCHHGVTPNIRFIAELRNNPADRHAAFLRWMRSQGHDYRHTTTWQSSWMLVALGEYLRLEPEQGATATVQLQDGTQMTLNNGLTRYTPPAGCKLSDLPTSLSSTQGTAYLNIKFRALPEQTEYPGVTEKGLQVTRVYEKKDADGNWKPTNEFNVGDVVRITLTCAKVAPELQYFVLEDYLPACMEAINPNVPSQAAGLEWRPWSHWFDHKEYLADRVRGFCTRWGGRNLLNMSYYARVKRAGISTAPPAEAQLMYEPQTYGLSPNAKIISK